MTHAWRITLAIALASCAADGQQSYYSGTNATGSLVLVRSVNALQEAQSQQLRPLGAVRPRGKERLPDADFRLWRPPAMERLSKAGPAIAPDSVGTPALNVDPNFAGFGFDGLTHAQQRMANGGNQYSLEPPNPSIAAGNGYVLQGVNNAIQVYNYAGAPLLPVTLSSNQLFGVTPAIIWDTGINGVFPTDMRVFYDQDISRWFVLQRAQDYDTLGFRLPSSRIYLAVSQTANPLGVYNIYTMDATNPGNNVRCPCIADYPQIGADKYGFYISANEFEPYKPLFVDATILAVSKAALASGAIFPTAYFFAIPWSEGYEFTIYPATTPPGASYALGSGGAEYFVSSQTGYIWDSNLALWVMTNTASLGTGSPALLLTRILVPTVTYFAPDVATQRPGPLPYGSTLAPPGELAYLDGGYDARILSLVYAGGRLYTTLAAAVTDETGHQRVGGIYAIISPAMRGGVLMAMVLRQGSLVVNNNHILRPAIAVNAQGRGAIVLTLVGPEYYPSAAFLPIQTFSIGSTLTIARHGAFPEDGFTGYDYPYAARWGDYSTAVVGDDGALWMTTEYIPNLPRTELANWGTAVIRYAP